MSKAKNNVNDLLAAIKRQTPAASAAPAPKAEVLTPAFPSEAPARKKTPHQNSEKKAAKSKKGSPVQFWMHDEDRKLVRELSAWLAGQGVRPSDSMVIRAALRFARTGNDFLEYGSRPLFPFGFPAGMKQRYALADGPTTSGVLKALHRIMARLART